MKTSFFVTCSLLYYLAATAQTPARTKPSLSSLTAITIRLNPDVHPQDTNSLFSHFTVIDQRPDTGRIGIHVNKASLGHSRDRQLIFPQPAAVEVANWLNQHYTRPGAPYTGLVVLRTLWLSDANYPLEDLMRDPQKQQERTHIRLKAEVYAGKDTSYMPVFRFDTLFYTTKAVYSVRSPYSDWERDLADILGELADSASFLADKNQGPSRQIPLAAIRQFNQSRFVLPIDNATLTSGVYANFEEFRNNAPSIQNYEIKMDGADLLLYIKDAGGKSYYSHNAWGYCNGKDIFIMRDGVLRFAWKEGKAFYFFSSNRSKTEYKGTPMLGGTPLATADLAGVIITSNMRLYNNNPYIYTIDMDTGSIY